jgi:hypothetical protein
VGVRPTLLDSFSLMDQHGVIKFVGGCIDVARLIRYMRWTYRCRIYRTSLHRLAERMKPSEVTLERFCR